VDRSWEYINRSQTHECGNWDCDRTIPFLGIHKWNFRCSVRLIAGTWYINCRSFLVGLGPSWGLGGFIIVRNSWKRIIISQTTENFQSVKVRTVKETCQSVKEGQSRKHVESVKGTFIYSVKAKNERKTLTKTCLSQPKKHVSQS
jgi:hypothetical protein